MYFTTNFINHHKTFRTNLGMSVLVLFMLTMISGCAVERNVQDNRFYSSFPKAIIDVDKKFDYLGSGKYQISEVPGMEDEFFVFSGKMNKQTIQKGIVIEFKMWPPKKSPNLQHYLKIDDKQKNIFAHGYKVINGKQHEYYITCTSSMSSQWVKDKWEGGNEIGKWVNSKGYILPRCGLQQRIIDFGVDVHKIITYVEDATLSGIECSKWYDKDQLPEKQKIYINDFTTRADQAIKFIEF